MTPLGIPVTESETVPVKLPLVVAVTLIVADWPRTRTTGELDALMANLGVDWMVSATVAVDES